jgi:hypothetical protein
LENFPPENTLQLELHRFKVRSYLLGCGEHPYWLSFSPLPLKPMNKVHSYYIRKESFGQNKESSHESYEVATLMSAWYRSHGLDNVLID